MFSLLKINEYEIMSHVSLVFLLILWYKIGYIRGFTIAKKVLENFTNFYKWKNTLLTSHKMLKMIVQKT